MPEPRLQCVVITPERTVLDEKADFIALPMYDGEVGVLPERAPLIGRLGFGELRTKTGAHVHRYFVDGGFVQVNHNVVTVLTPRALKAEELSVSTAEQALEAALVPGTTPEEQEHKLQSQDRARAQLRLARRAVGERD
jgi:F-type H+-transporting ATPase subunit epsilon